LESPNVEPCFFDFWYGNISVAKKRGSEETFKRFGMDSWNWNWNEHRNASKQSSISFLKKWIYAAGNFHKKFAQAGNFVKLFYSEFLSRDP
jgi:hypothetical protein